MSTLVVVFAAHVDGADLSIVDALARLELTARRMGTSIQVDGAPSGLVRLLELAGLCDVVRCSGESGVEVRRQVEAFEQRRVQEVVDVRDPAG